MEVPDELVYYFGLFLLEQNRTEEDKDKGLVVVRKLQEFESPYIVQKNTNCKLVLRKA